MNQQLFDTAASYLTGEVDEPGIRRGMTAIARDSGLLLSELMERVALQIAQEFLQKRLTYSDAMGMAACLYVSFFYEEDTPFPTGLNIWYEVYWALDEGEYCVASDNGCSPIETRVVPALLSLIPLAQAELTKRYPTRNDDA